MLNFIHYQSTSIKTVLLQPATYKSTVSGGLTCGSLVNAQIAGIIGHTAVDNNTEFVDKIRSCIEDAKHY
ncbi:VENN motif pre-toxin domain-containing protein [Snodgrassella communis]|uniref:VENN motif pre-toxin domain-containing protein n=1 Tax=Snodgrassella communis TaxID=2946699 RepID=UPI000C1F81E5|nr:VENN motif pre-toxin domain-containing protein [Snodgrassella communis]PIT20102.1 hypothetical protein BGI35_09200 [Snodgrassella communis]